MRSPLESVALCVAVLLVLGAGCASAEVDRVVKTTSAKVEKARARFEPAAVAPASEGAAVAPPMVLHPTPAASYQYWTAVAYLAEARHLRADGEFGQALRFVRVAEKAIAEALRLLEVL